MSGPKNGDEKLVVVSADVLRAVDLKQGFDAEPGRILDAIFSPGVATFLTRSSAENDPRFKQLVCYVILRADRAIFHYRRSSRVGETRLAGRRSLGVGGHLNVDDAGVSVGRQWLDRAIQRELAEEVEHDEVKRIEVLGIINEDTSDVGKVHVGIVALAELESTSVRLRDATLVDGRFDLPANLLGRSSEFETWSQLCLHAVS